MAQSHSSINQFYTTRDPLVDLTRRSIAAPADHLHADVLRHTVDSVRVEEQLAFSYCDVKLSLALLNIAELRTARSFAL